MTANLLCKSLHAQQVNAPNVDLLLNVVEKETQSQELKRTQLARTYRKSAPNVLYIVIDDLARPPDIRGLPTKWWKER